MEKKSYKLFNILLYIYINYLIRHNFIGAIALEIVKRIDVARLS